MSGEKSVLKFGDMYDYNIAVASCGSTLNLKQVELLIKKLGVENIIIAYGTADGWEGAHAKRRALFRKGDWCHD